MLQRMARCFLARSIVHRRRQRGLRAQERMELALKVTLGRHDLSRTLAWSTYARQPASKASSAQSASLFGGPPRRQKRDTGLSSITSSAVGSREPHPPHDFSRSEPRTQLLPHSNHSSALSRADLFGEIYGGSSWPAPPSDPAPNRRRPRPPQAAVTLRPTPPEASRLGRSAPRGYKTKMDPRDDAIGSPRKAAAVAVDVEQELFSLYGPHPALNERFRHPTHLQELMPPPRAAWESPRQVRNAAAILVAPVVSRVREPMMHGVKLQPGVQYLDIDHLKSQAPEHSDVPRLPRIATSLRS